MKTVVPTLKKIKLRYYITALVVAIAIVVGVIVLRQPSYSIDSSLLTNKTLDGITLTNISLVEESGVTTYQATVTATENTTVNYIEIVLTTGDDSVTLIGYVGKTLATGETSIIRASTDADIINATNIEYIMK